MNSRFLGETEDYKLVVQPSVNKDSNHLVYSIVNKKTDVVEAEVPFLVQGYEGLEEMQDMLDKHRDKINPGDKKSNSDILVN